MALEFRQNGHTVVSTSAEADTVVVNTCSVTNQAAADSRQKIRQAARNGAKEVIATGCWSTVEPTRAATLTHNVIVVDNTNKDRLVTNYLSTKGDENHSNLPFDDEPIAREPLPGLRQRTRAFIKAQDGCDNLCTFCVTRVARGKGVSNSIAEVIEDIQIAAQGGTQEIVLTGVHLGSWGQDLNPSLHLTDLIESILHDTDIPRVRLSSLEPWDLDRRFLRLWSDPRMMPHLHLPLQSGCDATLKRMLRKVTTASFKELVLNARELIPNVAITTDIITGFPGESEEEFAQTEKFVEAMNFAGAHVFTYSEREGTAAARIRQVVPKTIRKQRNKVLQNITTQSAQAYTSANIGSVVSVLWESSTERDGDSWLMSGLSGNYLKVYARSMEPIWNQISDVRLDHETDHGIFGEIQN